LEEGHQRKNSATGEHMGEIMVLGEPAGVQGSQQKQTRDTEAL
jgi:hypothetical protein